MVRMEGCIKSGRAIDSQPRSSIRIGINSVHADQVNGRVKAVTCHLFERRFFPPSDRLHPRPPPPDRRSLEWPLFYWPAADQSLVLIC